MMKSDEIYIREIVLPGDLLEQGLKPGDWTYEEDGKLYAMRVGVKSVISGYLNITPLEGRYFPKAGDRVIGIVIEAMPSSWLIDINSPYPALLHVNEVDRKLEFGETAKFLDTGESAFMMISSVDEVRKVQVSMKWEGLRRLGRGQIIEVSPTRVPRIIGRKGSMISILKEMTNCRITVGQNGRILIDGQDDDIAKATLAIKKVEAEAHTIGLTDRIKDYLKELYGKDER
jgi:exosome complex component RRP4